MGLNLLELLELQFPSFDLGGFQSLPETARAFMLGEQLGVVAMLQLCCLMRICLHCFPCLSMDAIRFVGSSSALVASPCSSPVLAAVLANVASSHNAFLGGSFLLAYR